jgi:hypothetical protein
VSYVALSGLIFRGTVTALHAATPGIGITDTSRTVIAHVDEVLDDPATLDLLGQDVTVELLAEPTMAVGYEGYFFTSLGVLGETVGVVEVAHIDPGVYPTLAADLPGILQLLADERLEARMQTAGAVVVGTVTSVTPLPDDGPYSEHDPLWAAATIAVECTLRGATPAIAEAAFATSLDVMWYASPKLAEGQQGVFFLQPAPSPAGPWIIPDAVP